ncbi:MAG TPA: post-COAP-1 domain-containing protein [Candidatus Limnocylindrales bacterium]|nr:post-COAP-1 domain-containing protein [Candidatus Limnocylindrales bacterium]
MVPRPLRVLFAAALLLGGLGASTITSSAAPDALDPVRNVALPCEAVSTPGLVPRSARNLAHVANVCGFVGTDIEFQSRRAADGTVHDYAFLGTMGGGTRIFDITDPAHPTEAGRYTDPGYQNDVAVRGDLLVLGFDSLGISGATSNCLRGKGSGTTGVTRAGIDIVRLTFDPVSATFTTSLIDCYLSSRSSSGAHTVTIHPSGEWISVNTSWVGVEVVDIRSGAPVLAQFLPDAIVDDAHDVSFSRDGNTLYSAGLDSTRVVDVTGVLAGRVPTVVATLPNAPAGVTDSNDPRAIQLSHQSDVSSDGRILVVTDEAGGGISETRCNEGPSGKIGAAHFWDVSTPAAPQRLGLWLYPNPGLLVDPLEPALAGIGRTERGCTIHVFRNGGNGSAGPGEIAAGFGGVSSLPSRQLVTAHYGAGTWWLDFSGPSRSDDGVAEDPRSTWGNTLGWNVMPGADTWSAKEYKGFIYTGDMTRGMDVFSFTTCQDAGCVLLPANTPGSASGGGKTEAELAEFTITKGTVVGGTGQFGLDVRYATGAAAPLGTVQFRDKAAGVKVDATSLDTLTIAGARATITGRATVNGTPGVRFTVEVEDLGKAGADTFRIVLASGYGAFGVVDKGNITVSGGLLGG